MSKNKWFLNGGRGNGRIFRLLCETYENKIADLQHKVDTLQGFLDHDIEYDMDKTIQEQKIKIADLEKENAELRKVAEFQQSSNMSRHFENKKLKEGLAIGSTFNKALNSMNRNLEEERDKYRNMVFDKDEQLTKAKALLKQFLEARNGEDTYKAEFEAEQFLKE